MPALWPRQRVLDAQEPILGGRLQLLVILGRWERKTHLNKLWPVLAEALFWGPLTRWKGFGVAPPRGRPVAKLLEETRRLSVVEEGET